MINFHFFFQNTDKSSLEELEGKENCFKKYTLLALESYTNSVKQLTLMFTLLNFADIYDLCDLNTYKFKVT